MPLPPQGPDSPPPAVLIPTPDPDQWVLSTTHEQNSVKKWPKAGVTLFGGWAGNDVSSWKQKIGSTGTPYSTYIFTDTAEAPAGWVRFLWVPVRTADQRKTPFRVHQYTGDQHWPAILKSINFIQDNQFMQATSNPNGGLTLGSSTYTRTVYVPEAEQGSLFRVSEYLSDVKYRIPLHPAPQTTDVSYDYLGARGSFPNCLHPDLKFPSLRTGIRTFTAGETGSAAGVLRGQRFPATDFDSWSPFFVSDKQTFVNGMWHRIQIEVFPPLEPETSIR